MANLTQTLTTRRAASKIIRAGAHTAAKLSSFNGNLLQGYMELCQDPDISIRKDTLQDLATVLNDVDSQTADEDFFPEVGEG